eukprot:TRINITY_DN4380_c0_g1_i2.p1 TRINITY_DN4380_c0_g1~~TRINITY_DN4380_c0_g1_i2.p1  ORF type:complete len:1347 (-),score=278.85 TRINITY_DN4380_c0_g1_i2:137-4177(-)
MTDASAATVSKHWEDVHNALLFSLSVSESDPSVLLRRQRYLEQSLESKSQTPSHSLVSLSSVKVGNHSVRCALGADSLRQQFVLSCAIDDALDAYTAWQQNLPDVRSFVPHLESQSNQHEPEGLIETTYAIFGWAASHLPIYSSPQQPADPRDAINHELRKVAYNKLHDAFRVENGTSSSLITVLEDGLKEGKSVLVCGHGVSGLVAQALFYHLLSRLISFPESGASPSIEDLHARVLGLCGRFKCITFGAPMCGPEFLVDLDSIHPAAKDWDAKGFMFHFANDFDVVPRLPMLEKDTRNALLEHLHSAHFEDFGFTLSETSGIEATEKHHPATLIAEASKQTALFLAFIPKKVFPIGRPQGAYSIIKLSPLRLDDAKSAEELYLSLALKPPSLGPRGAASEGPTRHDAAWAEYYSQSTKIAYLQSITSLLNSFDEGKFPDCNKVYSPTIEPTNVRVLFVGSSIYLSIPGNNMIFVDRMSIEGEEGQFDNFITHTNNLIQLQCPATIGTRTSIVKFTLQGRFGNVTAEVNITKHHIDVFHRVAGARIFLEDAGVNQILHYALSAVTKQAVESFIPVVPLPKKAKESTLENHVCEVQTSLYQVQYTTNQWAQSQPRQGLAIGLVNSVDLVPIPFSAIFNQYLPVLRERPESSLLDASLDTVEYSAKILDSDLLLDFDAALLAGKPVQFSFLSATSTARSEYAIHSRIRGNYLEKCAELAASLGVDCFKMIFKEFYLESAVSFRIKTIFSQLNEAAALQNQRDFYHVIEKHYKSMVSESSPLHYITNETISIIAQLLWTILAIGKIRIAILQSFSVAVIGTKKSGKTTICKALWDVGTSALAPNPKKAYLVHEFSNGFKVVDTDGAAGLESLTSSSDSYHPLVSHIVLVIPLQETESRAALDMIQDVLLDSSYNNIPFTVIFSKADLVASSVPNRESLEAEVVKRIESINRHVAKFYEKSEKDQKLVAHAPHEVVLPVNQRRKLFRSDCILMSAIAPSALSSQVSSTLREKGVHSATEIRAELGARFILNNGLFASEVDSFFHYKQRVTKAAISLQKTIRGRNVLRSSASLLQKRMERFRTLVALREDEESYVIQLRVVVDQYMQVLRDRNIIEKADVEIIFQNIDALLGIHGDMLKDIHSHVHANPRSTGDFLVGEVLAQRAKSLQIICEYATGFYDAQFKRLSLLNSNPAFAQFMKDMEGSFGLVFQKAEDLLHSPLTRASHTRKLIQKIIDVTDENHADYVALQEAAQLWGDLQQAVDESLQTAGINSELQRLLGLLKSGSEQLQKPGRFIRAKGNAVGLGFERLPLEYICFNDALLLLTGSEEDGLEIYSMVELSNLIVGKSWV